ncbi:unnamed protein product [Cylindrotheca closterium]|uniref:Uncharacterized protein n=1 Tax=Cylindrotheca closterium TaxID=2856 RepID=A0AAD2JM92_9STRA|nr:unnamed protein product [Cylindrotheca closterium]
MDSPVLIPRLIPDLSAQDNGDHNHPPSTSSKKYSKFSAHKVNVNRKYRAVANVVNTSKQRIRASFKSRAAQSSSSSSSALTTTTTAISSNKFQQLNPKQHLQKWMQPSEIKRKRTLNQRLQSQFAEIQEQNHDLLQQIRMEKMDFSHQRTELERERLELERSLGLNVNGDDDPKSTRSHHQDATGGQQQRKQVEQEPTRTMKPGIRNVPTPDPSSNKRLPFEASSGDPMVFSDESKTDLSTEVAASNSVIAASSAPVKEDANTLNTTNANNNHDDEEVPEQQQQQQIGFSDETKTELSAETFSNKSLAAANSVPAKQGATTTKTALPAEISASSAPDEEDATTTTANCDDDDEEALEQQQRPKFFSDESKTEPPVEAAANIVLDGEDANSTASANDDDDDEEEPEQDHLQSGDSLTDPRLQILTYFNTVSAEEIVTSSLAASPSVAEDPTTLQSERPPVMNGKEKPSSSESSVFTIWRPTSAEAIRKMVEGEGVGKGLEIKGKSSKAGALSGFVPYLQINKEEHKSKVRTMERGGRTRIFFATEKARDAVLDDLGPLQNNILNAVQDAKRTVRHSVIQVLYVPHHAKKKVKKAGKVAKKTAKKTAAMASSTVSLATNTVSTSVVTAGNAIHSGASKGLSQAGGSVSKLSQRTLNSVSSAGGAIANFTSPVSTTVAKATNPVGNSVAHFTSPVRSGVKKGVTMAAGTVTSSLFKAAKGVSNARVSVTDTVTSSVSMAGKAAKKTGKVAKKTVTQAASTVSTTVADPVAGSVVHVGSSIQRRASMVGAQASSTAKTAVRGMGISNGEQDDEVEFALKRLLWDMDDPSIRKIDDYSPRCYGIELPDRLLWQAFVVDSDISRPEDSRWFTGRPSQPAFQDMNLIAISKSRKNQKKTKKKKKKKKKGVAEDPLVVLWQTCTGDGVDDNPLDPRGLVMAYEECGRVSPVVSDFDCFTMGTRQIRYDVLPEEQIKLLDWCVSNIEDVLDRQNSSKDATWTDRWLDVLKSSAKKGFHPEIPKYGFGDAKSYDIVENAVDFLQESGAVRHGAECFNFYFPQDLDDEFLIVSESLPDDPKWRYVGVEELLDFLFERVKEGYTFPLNPKWVLCDDGRWKKLFDCLLTSEAPFVQESLEAWMPQSVRDKIEAIRVRHPDGFVSDKARDDEVCGTEAMDLAMLNIDRYMILRRARNKLWLMGFFLTLLRTVRERRAGLEVDNDEDSDEEVGSQESQEEGEGWNGGDESDELSEETDR